MLLPPGVDTGERASAPSSSPASLLSWRSVLASTFLHYGCADASGEGNRLSPNFRPRKEMPGESFRGPRGFARAVTRRRAALNRTPRCGHALSIASESDVLLTHPKDDFSGRGVPMVEIGFRGRHRRSREFLKRR